MHPLIVHLTVVAVPVAAMLMLWSLFKPVQSWVVSAMTFLAFAATAITNSTGEKLMVVKGASEEAPGIYADHALYAKFVVISAFVMFISALGIQFGGKYPVLVKSLRLLATVAALVALVAVVMTGHEGARLVWAQ